ncbi:hypothetical protein F5148DRAFT_1160354 [Russula earlei]|uniref:Uncharacterized protein n=1 Tax=Russula earlei TaxID=71964 RepID=A0ACC0UMI9_9AGAM|nr:hypothetical protein F5148DRAFT_1160354 [Russula earlei]
MLARNAFKAAKLVPGSRRAARSPNRRVRPLSDVAAKSSQPVSFSGKEHKKDWTGFRLEECVRDSSHLTHELASLLLTNDPISSQSSGSPNYVPNQLLSFRSSIAQRDASAVLSLWRSLEKDNLLHLLGPSDLETCSRLVVNLCPVEPGSTWSEPLRAPIEELALALSNKLSTSALRACFTSLVIINDSEGVLRLYDRFLNVFEDDSSFSNEGMEEELSAIPTIHVSGSPFDKELSLFAIMALVIQNDFPSAIQFGMRHRWNLPFYHAANAFLDSFAPALPFRKKVSTFLRHAGAARFLSRPSLFHKHLDNLVSTPAPRSLQTLYTTVVEGLSEKYPWAIVDSQPPAVNRPVTIQERTWMAFIAAFLNVQRLDLAESAWDDMVKYGHKPGPGVWAVLIKGVGNLKGPSFALALWRSMKEACRQWKDATKLFNEFRTASPPLSGPHQISVFNTMISAHLNNSQEPDAIDLLEAMLAGGPNPTTHTFNLFLTYYHSNYDMRSLSSMFKKMTSHGVPGDVATFSILLCTLLRILDRGEAIQQTFVVMDQHKIKPNVATYTAIMTSLLQEKDKKALEAALDLLRTMEESGDRAIAPNVVTYTAILNGVHGWVGRDDRLVQECTELIVRKMKMRHIKFNKVTYNVLLKTCLENPSPAGVQKALQFYRQMRREKTSLTGDTWHIILHGLARRSEWVVAHEVLRDMQESGLMMTDWLENVAEEVIRGYSKSRKRLATAKR